MLRIDSHPDSFTMDHIYIYIYIYDPYFSLTFRLFKMNVLGYNLYANTMNRPQMEVPLEYMALQLESK